MHLLGTYLAANTLGSCRSALGWNLRCHPRVLESKLDQMRLEYYKNACKESCNTIEMDTKRAANIDPDLGRLLLDGT